MKRFVPTSLLAAALLATTLFAGGCSTGNIGSTDLRKNWTPELDSLTMGDEQFDNFRSRHRHNKARMINDDWAMIWLQDRNLRLTRYTLP